MKNSSHHRVNEWEKARRKRRHEKLCRQHDNSDWSASIKIDIRNSTENNKKKLLNFLEIKILHTNISSLLVFDWCEGLIIKNRVRETQKHKEIWKKKKKFCLNLNKISYFKTQSPVKLTGTTICIRFWID